MKNYRLQKLLACRIVLEKSLKSIKMVPILDDHPYWRDHQPSQQRENDGYFGMTLSSPKALLSSVVKAGEKLGTQALKDAKQFPAYIKKELPKIGPAMWGGLSSAWASMRRAPAPTPKGFLKETSDARLWTDEKFGMKKVKNDAAKRVRKTTNSLVSAFRGHLHVRTLTGFLFELGQVDVLEGSKELEVEVPGDDTAKYTGSKRLHCKMYGDFYEAGYCSYTLPWHPPVLKAFWSVHLSLENGLESFLIGGGGGGTKEEFQRGGVAEDESAVFKPDWKTLMTDGTRQFEERTADQFPDLEWETAKRAEAG
ncbi:MAG: hypothetical protein M1823_003787 [Watsoniomyces obsoletus]|nr:MAG: hypothetical protein M1823_003787 [Watsoniomyces obsoletus]